MRVPDLNWPARLFTDIIMPVPESNDLLPLIADQTAPVMTNRVAPWHGWVTNLFQKAPSDVREPEESTGDSVHPHHPA